MAASVGGQGAAGLANVMFARLLGPGDYGRYAAVQITITTLAGFLQVAMGGTAAKYVAEYRSTEHREVFELNMRYMLGATALAIVGVLLLSPWIPVLLGERYAAARPALMVLLPSCSFESLTI